MNDRPNALELIQIANQTLVESILPDAKPEQLYTLRMIANALGIAARELESRDADNAFEASSLAALYEGAPPDGTLNQRNQQLARDIRSGRFENSIDAAAKLRAHLVTVARAKLAVSYPKGLVSK